MVCAVGREKGTAVNDFFAGCSVLHSYSAIGITNSLAYDCIHIIARQLLRVAIYIRSNSAVWDSWDRGIYLQQEFCPKLLVRALLVSIFASQCSIGQPQSSVR